jgi:hypothetical protein
MTPKEKASWLVLKFMSKLISLNISKQCALIAVDEILEDNRTSLKLADDENLHPHARGLILGSLAIWLEVKQEIEKL